MGAAMTDVLGVAHRSEVVKTRRGYALVLMGLILPGSAQAVHGRRRLGRFALSLWIVLVAVAVVALILTLLFRNTMIGVIGNGWVLQTVAILIFALAAFWGLLALDTWWMSRPASMGRKKGAIFSAIALVLAVSLTVGTVWVGRAAWATGGALSHIFIGGGSSTINDGRYNILLLGSDAGSDREGIRPDSVNVLSIDATTGRTIIFGMPRNLEWVPFPDSSPLHALYPDGYGCASEDCMLNAIYLLGEQNASLYPGVDDPGVQATIEGVSAATGLSINYYALIDMQGFVDLIDALGGLTITLNEPVILDTVNNVWLQAGPNQHLNGFQTLWFARSRTGTSDFDRMQRQKCVMAAVLNQLNPATVAAKFTDLMSATGETARTSVPPSKIGMLTDLALKAKTLPIISVEFTPPLIHPGDPDYDLMRATVANTIAQAKALDAGQTPPPDIQPPASDNPDPSPSGSSPTDTSTSDSSAPLDSSNITTNLGQICSVG